MLDKEKPARSMTTRSLSTMCRRLADSASITSTRISLSHTWCRVIASQVVTSRRRFMLKPP